jgi:hypothetical protein
MQPHVTPLNSVGRQGAESGQIRRESNSGSYACQLARIPNVEEAK